MKDFGKSYSTSESEEDTSTESGKDTREITWTNELFRPNIHKFHCKHSKIKTSISYSAAVLEFFNYSVPKIL